jgi:pSer/pThr/pTyr-binding forkhead associated (FHA) protein
MKLSLVVLTAGKQEGKVLPIALSQFVIGRDPQCQLRPASPLISKRHCALIQREGKAFVRDFDSTNGTFLNDKPVKGEVELHHDDRLKVGPLTFQVKLEATAPVNRPTPAPPTKSVAGAVPTPAPAKAPSAGTPVPPTKAPAGGSEDDDVHAMLMEIQDDPNAVSSLSGDEVPEGSTVMDVPVPAGGAGDKDKGKQRPNPNTANTSSAAKSILEKYMKRPRS